MRGHFRREPRSAGLRGEGAGAVPVRAPDLDPPAAQPAPVAARRALRRLAGHRLLRHRGLLKEKEFEYFCNVGLDADLDFTFFIPSIEEFECAVRKSGLYVESIQHTEDVFTKFYPLYILRKGVLS